MCMIFTLVAALLVVLPVAGTPVPRTWPESFSQRFAQTDGSTGLLTYDWPTRTQRIDHFNNTASRLNQVRCAAPATIRSANAFGKVLLRVWHNPRRVLRSLLFSSTQMAALDCSEFFTAEQEMFAYFPSSNTCCVESCAGGVCREAPVGLPKPNWVSMCDYQKPVVLNATSYKGTYLWFQCPVCLNVFVDPVTLQTQLFLSDNLKYGVIFEERSLSVGHVNRTLLQLPAACQARVPCKGATGPLECNRTATRFEF
jgi:hypothetical protein